MKGGVNVLQSGSIFVFVQDGLFCVIVTLTQGTIMTELFYLPPILGFAGLISAFVIYLLIKKAPVSNPAIIKIGDAIHSGAMVFMHREYKMLFLFALVVGIALYFSLGQYTTMAFVAGALCSATAGYMGMFTATKANVRTTQALFR